MRILVVPASRYGGTAEIGRFMATTLRQAGFDVDVSQPEHMFDLTPYGAHIIGSGLYLGQWIDRAATFVEEYGDGLRRHPTWLFSSGPLGPARPEEPVRADVVDKLMEATGAVEHRLFGGRLELDRLPRTDRFIAEWVGATDGDHRPWDEIEAWVLGIADRLRGDLGPEAVPEVPAAPAS
jgi:menaquinone-dependent protoporphyrinogen oxidase